MLMAKRVHIAWCWYSKDIQRLHIMMEKQKELTACKRVHTLL